MWAVRTRGPQVFRATSAYVAGALSEQLGEGLPSATATRAGGVLTRDLERLLGVGDTMGTSVCQVIIFYQAALHRREKSFGPDRDFVERR